MKITIVSDLREVDKVCEKIQKELESAGLSTYTFSVNLLIREFLNNAILHGNGSNREKKVVLNFKIRKKYLIIKVSDEGPGFDWRGRSTHIPDRYDVNGRGLFIGRKYADKLKYNSAGNKVLIRIKIKKIIN